jgi:hypothetical protein
MHSLRETLVVLTAVAGIVAVGVIPATAQTIGMVADRDGAVIVFDADADIVMGSITLPTGGRTVGDCAMTADQTLGFVTDFQFRIWVIDLTASPPALASGTNPINISNNGEDLTITFDQKYLLACDGGNIQPISVVDIATRTEINTFSLADDCNSIEVCAGGSVLVTSEDNGTVQRLTVDASGNLTDTGELLSTGFGFSTGPNNVFGAPNGRSGIVVLRSGRIWSFTIPGLGLVDDRALSGTGIGLSGLADPVGARLFVRSSGGWVDAFGYDCSSAALSAAPLWSIEVSTGPTFFGMDQMAQHPNGTKLYVSQPGALNVYDASTGALLNAITHPSIQEPTGVSFRVDPPPVVICPDDMQVPSFSDLPDCDPTLGAAACGAPVTCVRQSLSGAGCTDDPIDVQYLYTTTDESGVSSTCIQTVTVAQPDCPIPVWLTDAAEPAACACHGDPLCDGVTNVLDVVKTVGVAFRGDVAPVDPVCTAMPTDADCDGVTTVLDVVRFVNVAFRGGDPAVEFQGDCGS